MHKAALHQFTHRGYEHVSIASIAKDANIAVGTVYRFYENKISLLRAMLREIEDEFVDRMRSDWNAGGKYPQRLDRICEGLFDVAKDRSELLRLFSMTTDVVYEDGYLPGELIQSQIKDMYLEAMNEGVFREGDVEMMAAMAHGLVEGAMMRWMRMGAPTATNVDKELASVMKSGFLT
ncbi:TetR/AcrR family transcriptional regulator [Roseibium sp. HPY-6]|uniref:TetR/AcrR family transcriptional regulator n=1 Tax=Roseibium sp. HPY-6 TaxID=3229852 RepID=UPI00338E61D0